MRGIQCRSRRGRTLDSSSFVYFPENSRVITCSSARRMQERRQSASFLSEPWHIKKIILSTTFSLRKGTYMGFNRRMISEDSTLSPKASRLLVFNCSGCDWICLWDRKLCSPEFSNPANQQASSTYIVPSIHQIRLSSFCRAPYGPQYDAPPDFIVRAVGQIYWKGLACWLSEQI